MRVKTPKAEKAPKAPKQVKGKSLADFKKSVKAKPTDPKKMSLKDLEDALGDTKF